MDGQLTDTLVLLVTACAGVFLLCAGVYLAFRWIKNITKERLVVLIRKTMPLLWLHGISLICGGTFFFLAREVFYDELPVPDRHYFVRLGWTCFVGGVAFAIAAALGRRFIRPGPENGESRSVTR